MFENISDKIKIIAKVYFGAMGIIGVLLGIITWSNGNYYGDFDGSVFVGGLFNIIISLIIGWILSCLMYGFAELIENTQATNSALFSIRKKLDEINKNNQKPIE